MSSQENHSLLSENEILENIINSSPTVVFIWKMEKDWPVLFVSEAVNQFGYSREDFLQGNILFSDLIFPGDLERVTNEVHNHLKNGANSFQQQYRIVTRDGTIRHVSDWTMVQRDTQGKPEQAQGILLDITEQVGHTERVENFLRNAGILFLVLDEHGNILEANEKTAQLTNTSKEQLLTSNWIDQFIPETEKPAIQLYLDLLTTTYIPSFREEHVNPIIDKEGNEYIIHWTNTIEDSLIPSKKCLVCFGIDITEQKISEKIADNFARFPRENPNPVLRIDRNGDILVANDAAIELIQKNQGAEHHRSDWRALIEYARNAENSINKEMILGEQVFLFSIAPSSREEDISIYGIDITQQKEQEIRLSSIQNDLPGAIWLYIVDKNNYHFIEFMNNYCERLWGITNQELNGDPSRLWSMVHPEDRQCLEKSLEKSVLDLTPWEHEYRIITPESELTWVYAKGTPYRDHNGDTHFTTIAFDKTREKQSQLDLANAYRKTINVLSNAVEVRDPYTAGHEHNVAEIAIQIAKQLGLDEHQIQGIELAASIHDVGKIQIPTDILNKPRKLTKNEFELVKEHPVVGEELLKNIDFDWPIATIIRQHHERLDGSGYPDGLKGDTILLESRIIAVADVVEAIGNHRPYRPALGKDAVLEEIKQGSGIKYDREVVNACVSLIEKERISFS